MHQNSEVADACAGGAKFVPLAASSFGEFAREARSGFDLNSDIQL
jgi:hypothetical protein